MAGSSSNVWSTLHLPAAQHLQQPTIPAPAAGTTTTTTTHVLVEPRDLTRLAPLLLSRSSASSSSSATKSKVVVHVSTKSDSGDHAKVTPLLARHAHQLKLIYSPTDSAALSLSFDDDDDAETSVHFGEFDPARLADKLASSSSSSSSTAAASTTNGHAAAAEGNNEASVVLLALGGNASALSAADVLPADWALRTLSSYPRTTSELLSTLSLSSQNKTQTLVVLEQVFSAATKWNPLFLDALAAVDEQESQATVLSATLGQISNANKAIASIKAAIESRSNPFTIGELPAASSSAASAALVKSPPKHEGSYTRLLAEAFGDRLWLANSPSLLPPSSSSSSTATSSSSSSSSVIPASSPEYALGHVLALEHRRRAVRATLQQSGALATHSAVTRWLAHDRDADAAKALVDAIDGVDGLDDVRAFLKHGLGERSSWIIGSEAWAHDLGASGLHHALSTGANVNLLLVDTTPYTLPTEHNSSSPRCKDAALYAMNYGNAYVASVAIYGDFAQTLRALHEADAYQGPAVVVAYLPSGERDSTTALQLLKQTKQAIEVGSWPLYRWNPHAATEAQAFELDSEKIKHDVRAFLDRQNHLTELSRRLPSFDAALEYGSADVLANGRGSRRLQDAQRRKAREAFDALTGNLEGPPLLVLFASDGGAAEKVAKRFAQRARARTVAARLLAFDDFAADDLALEQNIVFVTSTAGQGEFPQNGREMWKHLSRDDSAPKLANTRVGVFAMGDSHYWPRKEDAHYYNKPGKDLHRRLADLGARELVPIGLGDDQDPDGPQTAYKVWEPLVWKALAVDDVLDESAAAQAEPEPITNEHIKIASNFLRGTVAEGLQDKSTGALAESDGQITKFHGIYQQDDRDIRDERKAQGLEPAYSFMVRMRLPAGVCKPEQWLAVDEIAGRRGNDTFKLTTRQTFQFHGIVKHNLKPAIQEINKMMLDTIAACGDVNRTVMCSANPSLGKLHSTVADFATELSDGLLPRTSAYGEIWLDKTMVAGEAVQDHEPLYGPYYLPRKFKIAIAVPPTNDVDVFCHDLGYIAVVDENKQLLGYNVTIGGGMGVTHSMKTTYPRLADVVGFITPEKGLEVAKAVMLTQRDNGNRANRKNARVKYTVDRMGIDAFKAEVEKRAGFKFEPARPYTFTKNVDQFGWQTGDDGRKHFTVFIENGRVQDEPGRPYRTGMREIAKAHKGVFRLTANQHLIISDINPGEDERVIADLLAKYKLDKIDFSGLRLSSAACVAFPTCGLAMAESERYLPVLIDKVEEMMEEAGLRNDSITMRMTGCPNGCARPWAAEVAFVGKAPGSYLMLLGGGYHGQRLNKIYREAVGEQEILDILRPMIKAYALERLEGEHFGDFVIRKGIITPTTAGKAFYDGMNPGLTA